MLVNLAREDRQVYFFINSTEPQPPTKKGGVLLHKQRKSNFFKKGASCYINREKVISILLHYAMYLRYMQTLQRDA